MSNQNIDMGEIESKVYLIRGVRVMLDSDLAELYQVPTKRLNEQVRRNPSRFPSDFMFTLTNQEVVILRSQIATSRFSWGGGRYLPKAFTEEGVAMLSAVLNSESAIGVNIAIMRVFVRLRRVRILDGEFESRMSAIEEKFDAKFKVVFDAIRTLASERKLPRKRIVGLAPKKKK